MGSSKSYIGLMRHLRWVEDPNYRGYCIRKNATTLMKSGGLFEEAVEMYRQYEPNIQIKLKDQKIIFPSKASVTFSHYENDKSSELYRGLQLSSVFYDEASDAQESHIWFLIQRLRSKAKMVPSIWLTCNPMPDTYLREWVDWWLYPEGHEKFGLPDPEKNGKERWVLRVGGDLLWGDSREELILKYGKPHLDEDHPQQVKPLSFTVLLGTIYDNPVLMETNPHYLSSLEAQPEVEKQRNLYGNWEAREESSTYFNRSWVEEVNYVDESEVLYTVRTHDLAGSLPSDLLPDPDHSVSTRMRKMKDGTYIIDDIRRTRIRHGDWFSWILSCSQDDPPGTIYYIPEDPNPAAARAAALFARELSEAGLFVRRIKTNKSKLDRFRPFSSMAQNGGVKFLKACGSCTTLGVLNDLKFVYAELENFTGERKRGKNSHDDIVDTLSDAFTALASKTTSLSGISKNLITINQTMNVGNPFNGMRAF